MLNPFIPFTIAASENFINRAAEIKTILERVSKGAGSGIVGNPHIGKSSLLLQISRPEVVAQFIPEPEQYIFVHLDLQSFTSQDSPDDFWAYILEECDLANPAAKAIVQPLLTRQTFDSRRLLSVFSRLGQSGYRVVLLIDELDYLFNLPHFNNLDFVGPLRVLAMKSTGLILVTASRLSVAQLNRQAATFKDTVRGSDLFNYLEEISLGSFQPPDVRNWLEKYFQQREVIEEIRLLAGHHPLLLQLAGELYFEADLTDEEIRRERRRTFINKAETQFQDIWDYLEPKAQVTLVIFVLTKLSGVLSSGEKFSLEETQKYLTWYKGEINAMLKRGTLEAGPTGQIDIGSYAFILWIAENKIVGTREDEPQEVFTQWLADKQFKLGGLLTQEEINWLQKTWQKIPSGFIDLARKAILPKGWQ